MSYATPADLKSRYTKVDLTDPTVQTYLDEANSYINSRLVQAFSLPFSSIPLLVKYMEIDYAFGKILMRPRGDGNTESENGEQLLERIDADLSAIVNGKIALVDTDGQIISMKVKSVRSSASESPVFSMEDEY